AVELAIKAVGNKTVHVAGSVGPLGIGPEEAKRQGIDRALCFREQISALLDAGVGLIFFETFTDLEEMEIAFAAKKGVTDLPAICSLVCDSSGRLGSGVSLGEALRTLRETGANILGVNCVNDSQQMVALLNQARLDGAAFSVFPSAGRPKCEDSRLVYEVTPESFAEAGRDLILAGARLIGGCCGTTPRHIAALASVIQNHNSKT
ncbi:MAG TPA: homocysteine S-methyltransferase family protein, partial [Chthoniobacterales bacterium]